MIRRFNSCRPAWLAALAFALALPPAAAAQAQPTQAPAAAAANGYAARPDVRRFAADVAARHGLDERSLLALLSRARSSESVLRLIEPAPPGKRSWSAYRNRFVEPRRIREGSAFWDDNVETLRRASQRWGVPQELIVAIIGIETFYGRHTGEHRVLDALATLAFDYPRRADYFRGELEQFLLLARSGQLDPLETRGSFAGAIGLPQFMPTSIRRWAVDFDGDGTIDLRHSAADAIGSVANFLAAHGWRPGGPTHFEVSFAADAQIAEAVEAGIPPRLSMLELTRMGISSPEEIAASERLALIDLPDADAATRYVLGAHNFYVITRYNRSYFYAMAVIELAQALKASSTRAAR